MNWPLYRSMHARGMTQARLAELTGLHRSVVARLLTNEPGRGKETRVKLFPHLNLFEIYKLGWQDEYLAWRGKSSTSNIVPPTDAQKFIEAVCEMDGVKVMVVQ